MKSSRFLSVVFFGTVTLSAFACAKSSNDSPSQADAGDQNPEPTGDDDNGTSGTTSGSTGTPIFTNLPTGDDDDDTTDGGHDGGSTKSDASVPQDCSTTVDQSDCLSCCGTQHSEGYKTYKTAVNACVCGADVCEYECKDTLCSGHSASASCQTCKDDRAQGSCASDVNAACANDQDCVAFQTCTTTSKCSTKQQ